MHLAALTQGHGDDEVRRRVCESIPRAKKYGLMSEQQVMRFVDATFLLGEHFENEPGYEWAAEILHNENLGADEKSRLLLAIAIENYNRGIDFGSPRP
jgi:hypothetical protein